MNGLMNIIMVAIVTTVAPGDPPTFSVEGDIVTFSADFVDAYALPSNQITVIKGVPCVGTNQVLASNDGVSPIIVKLPPGTYAINAFGFPVNRMFPQRAFATFNVVIDNPDRITQIKDAVVRYSVGSDATAKALADLKLLKPTKEELKTALSNP